MKQPNPNPKKSLSPKKYPKKMFKRSDTVSEYMDDESTRRKKLPKRPQPKRTPQTTPSERQSQTLERRLMPYPYGGTTPRYERILPRRIRPKVTTPRDERILPRRPRPDATKRTPLPLGVRPYVQKPARFNSTAPRAKAIVPKPARYNSTDSLNTSRYAGPFRKPKNLTDSLGTASPVARKYRKLGSK